MSGKILPMMYKTTNDKLSLGIWPWTRGLLGRLPLHYKKSYVEKFMKEPRPVHYTPDPRTFTVNDYGRRERLANYPIPLKRVPEQDMGLWGGESFIFGYKKRKDIMIKPSIPHIWKPRLMKRTLYSEILDRWMSITVTRRTLELIDEAYGFDYYILKTHEVDLGSNLGMRLKREMLLTLANKSMYKENPSKRDEIYEKYKEFIIPVEEAEWVGLSLMQAEKKQAILESEEVERNTRPLKEVFMTELLDKMRENRIEEEDDEPKKRSVLNSINPFKRQQMANK